MGTSISQGSPRTRPWSAVAAAYASPAVPIDRVVKEIWRAARSDPETNWQSLLTTPAVNICLRAAIAGNSPQQALQNAAREIAHERASSLVAEIAKRATVRAFSQTDRALGFAQALLCETSNYLVSRDLPGHLGPQARNKTISEAIAFKRQIVEQVAQTVQEFGRPSADRERWQGFVRRVIDRLAR